MPYYLLIITTVYYVYSMIVYLNPYFSFITTVDPTEDDNTNYNENIADCEHRSRNRVQVSDGPGFRDNPARCDFCDAPTLDGTDGKTAIRCTGCGCTICEICNAPNSDPEKDSGIGEE